MWVVKRKDRWEGDEIKPTKVVRRNKNKRKITGGLFVDFFGSSVLVRGDVRAWSAWGRAGDSA